MFRLFLKKKIESSSNSLEHDFSEKVRSTLTQSPSPKNRRSFTRHVVDYKHLTLLNEQDILIIRDISLKGFSTEVAPRTSERMAIGDNFEGRIRYLGETYDLQFKVAWKSATLVGFEIVETPEQTIDFLNRLIKPIEIATSLTEIDNDIMQNQEPGKTWYHSEKNCDLYTWKSEDGEISAWWLMVEDMFVKWTRSAEGLVTGSLLTTTEKLVAGFPARFTEQAREQQQTKTCFSAIDNVLDNNKRQMAVDIFMALELPVRDELIKTLSD